MVTPTRNELLIVHPIGIAHTPFSERREAPRQPAAANGACGRIELFPNSNFEHALEDVAGFSHLWLLFWFHGNKGWRPKVLPARSTRRRGLFSTRSPHRPNPIGLSLVELERIEGLTLHVRNVDLLDGSPILDIKPYVAYADLTPNARSGWLRPLASPPEQNRACDPEPGFEVCFESAAAKQIRFLQERFGVDLGSAIAQVLALGPQPHAYRRIQRTERGFRLAIKAWRADFVVSGRQITVTCISSGYRARQLALDEASALDVHRAFVAEFGRIDAMNINVSQSS